MDTPSFSVVICTYKSGMFEHFCDAVESALQQTYDDVEVVVVVDGDDRLAALVDDRYRDASDVTIHRNAENRGLAASRNAALDHVTGDVVAFLDDDAVAERDWLAELADVYQSGDAIAAGGEMTPIWMADKPRVLPEEFYWLIGVTHRGFAEPGDEVRNTFGSNISIKTDVLQDLGGFDPDVGRRGDENLQAEEPLLGAKMQAAYGKGVVYNPDARVGHKIFAWRTRPGWLIDRAFWQGYSKSQMQGILPDDGDDDEEADFLQSLATRYVPQRAKALLVDTAQLLALFALTALVGLGYVYGRLSDLRGGGSGEASVSTQQEPAARDGREERAPQSR